MPRNCCSTGVGQCSAVLTESSQPLKLLTGATQEWETLANIASPSGPPVFA
ncbi:unnamed protein product, partial [Nesidiocoris tenuis]